MFELIVAVSTANCSRLLRCICRNLALPSQQTRGQKRRASANDDSSWSSDEVTAVLQPEHEYSQRSHELSHSVLADIRSVVESDARDDANGGEMDPMQAHDLTSEPVCMVRHSMLNLCQRMSVVETMLDATLHGLRCNGAGNIVSDASHPGRRHSCMDLRGPQPQCM